MVILGQARGLPIIIATFTAVHMHVPCQVLCQYELIYLHISPLNHHITSEETEAWGGGK